MNILALDPATSTGFARSDGPYGTIDLSIRRDESTGFRLIRLRSKLRDLCDPAPNLVVFEAARNAGIGGAVVVQAELQGVIKLFCTDHDIEYRGYSPSEIKKHATNKGNAGKDAMLLAAQEKWPDRKFANSDEVDACWLLDLAEKEYGE